jgi:signal peptidase I
MDNDKIDFNDSTPTHPQIAAPIQRGTAHDPERANTQESFAGALWDWMKSIVVGFLIFLVIRIFLIQTFTIVSGSMENTLLVGDFLLVSKSAYGAMVPGTHTRLPAYSEPRRNDIVVFKSHDQTPEIDLVKRLVGLPGDTLAMKDGVLFVNRVARSEPWLKHDPEQLDGGDARMDWQKLYLVDPAAHDPYFPTRDNWGPIVVPDGEYFMMGDNREWSLDSRYWGFVPRKDMTGRAVALYFSFDPQQRGRIPFFEHVRWNRIAKRLH